MVIGDFMHIPPSQDEQTIYSCFGENSSKHNSIGIQIYNSEGFLFDANSKNLEIFGITDKSELKNLQLFKHFQISQEGIDLLEKSEPFTYETVFDYDLIRKIGLLSSRKTDPIRLKISIEPFKNLIADSQNYIVLIQNISEHTNDKNQQLLNVLLESTPNPIYIKDASCRIIMANNATLKAFGKTAEEIIGKKDVEIYDDIAIGKAIEANDLKVMLSQETISTEERISNASGEWYYISIKSPYFDKDGKVAGVFGISHDITDRKRAEMALARSELKYRQLVENISDIIFSVSPEGFIEYISPQIQKYNYAPDDLIGKLFTTLIYEEDRLEIANTFISMIDKGIDNISSFQFRAVAKSGDVVWMEGSGQLIRESNGKILGLRGIIRDVSNERNADLRLRESEEKYRLLHESAGVGIRYYTPDGIVISFNKIAAKNLNGTPDDFVGKSIYEIYPIEKAVVYFNRIKKVISSNSPHGYIDSLEIENTTKWFQNLYTRITDSFGNTFGIQVVSIDITERIQAEERLKKSEDRYRRLLERGNDAIYIYEVRDNNTPGKFTEVNEMACVRLGYSRNELLQMSPLSIDHPDYYDVLKNAMDILLAKGNHTFEMIHVAKGGNHIPVEINAHLFEIDGCRMVMSIARDITERKITEDKLKESLRTTELRNAELSAIIEAIPHAVYFGNGGGITRCNQMALRMLGATSLENLQERIAELGEKFRVRYSENGNDLVEPENLPFTKALNGVSSQLDTWATKADTGENVLIQGNSAPVIIDNKVIGAVAVNIDITERKRTEDSLAKTNEKFARAQRIAHIGHWEAHLPTGELTWSDEMYNIMGLNRDKQLFLSDVVKCFPPDELKRFEKAVSATIKEDKPYNMDYRIIRPDGVIQYIHDEGEVIRDKQGNPIWMVGTTHNITKRKEIELSLSTEKERLAVTLRSIGDGVITTDIQGKIQIVNKAAEQLTGWTQDEAINKPLTEVFNTINDSTKEKSESPVEKVLRTKSVVELANHTTLVSRDGKETSIINSAAPIRDKDNQIIGVVLVFRDMTEKQKLLESNQRADKLDALGILAGGIAHDFNNLLGGIYGYVDMARETCPPNCVASEYLAKSLKTFTRARDLTQQLITFAKGGAPSRKTASLAPLLRDNAQFAMSGSNVICKFTIPDDLWSCDFDENQISQVIDNLVINAVQAMPKGGCIFISAQNLTIKDGEYNTLKAGRYVCVSFKDTGVGIPSNVLPRIFDPFFTTKNKGNGLGLATVYSIIKKHDGEIIVDSIPNRGTTFNIYIPVSENEKVQSVNAKTTVHKGVGNILLMDDEEFIQETVRGMIAMMGYDVDIAINGQEAIEKIKLAMNSPKPFIGAIMDLTIPGGMGGKDAIKEIRLFNQTLPIFVSSGYSEDPVMANPVHYGFTDKIQKPFMKTELMKLFSLYL